MLLTPRIQSLRSFRAHRTLRACLPSAVSQRCRRSNQAVRRLTKFRIPELPSLKDRGVTEMLFLAVPTLPGNGWTDLLHNRIFVTGFVSWSLAQILKVFTEYCKSGKFDLRPLVMAGGMPSSHSSVCVAVTTSIALQQGLGSALFAAAFCFTSIVMYDAAGIRRHAGHIFTMMSAGLKFQDAGYQAKILNELMSGLRPDLGDQASLKEVLGHSRREVAGGALLGLLIGLFWPM